MGEFSLTVAGLGLFIIIISLIALAFGIAVLFGHD